METKSNVVCRNLEGFMTRFEDVRGMGGGVDREGVSA